LWDSGDRGDAQVEDAGIAGGDGVGHGVWVLAVVDFCVEGFDLVEMGHGVGYVLVGDDGSGGDLVVDDWGRKDGESCSVCAEEECGETHGA
jgi:hypothetical protein